MKPRAERYTEMFVIRVTPSEAVRLDHMAAEGGYPSRAALARSIIKSVLDDDERAHGGLHECRSKRTARA